MPEITNRYLEASHSIPFPVVQLPFQFLPNIQFNSIIHSPCRSGPTPTRPDETGYSSPSPKSPPISRNPKKPNGEKSTQIYRNRERLGMKITSILIIRSLPGDENPVILANACDVSHFGYFQRSSVREFIVFVARTVAKRTPPGQRQSVQHEEYKVHAYNRGGLCALGFMDDHYPVRSAFSLLNQVVDEYQKDFGESWKTLTADSAQPWPYLNEALTKYQDPAEADKLLRIQRELDETKIILHKTIDSVLARGERLDSLVEKSSDLSAASQMFYKQAKKTNQCCTIL